MITDDVINKDTWSFASDTVVMSAEEVEEFLRSKKVID